MVGFSQHVPFPSPFAYPAPEQRDKEMQALTKAAGGEVIRYGDSVAGRPLLAARLPATTAPAEGARAVPPAVLVTANIHGPEYVASRVAMGFLAAVDQLESLRRLRARADVWVIPCLNPDGYARTWEMAGKGRLADLRANARGVDLNRNFPLPAGGVRRALPGAGSSRPGAATYVGPHALSEPETDHLATFLGQHRFVASSNGHSFMGATIPARVRDREQFKVYKQLCAAFAAAQPQVRYHRLSSRYFDTYTGEMEDFQHHHHGTWALCLESFSLGHSIRQHLRAPSLFHRFNPHDPAPWVANDVPGIAAFLNAALDLPPPAGAHT